LTLDRKSIKINKISNYINKMTMKNDNIIFRNIPGVDEILSSAGMEKFCEDISRENLVRLIREKLELIRISINNGDLSAFTSEEVSNWIIEHIDKFLNQGQQAVINASGIIIHTNLGRSLLSEQAIQNLQTFSKHYSNLEYDFINGKRSHRNQNIAWLLTFLTGAEDAFAVNNNAAAVVLSLNTVAKGREAIISRGELVEIGGGFRIPEVMNMSGASLREVGTTNKTKLTDYRNAINEKTAVLVKVHTSNYRVVGFTHETSLEDLVKLGREFSIPVLHDLGSGKLYEKLSAEPVPEPTVEASVRAGADLVTFSADKILGGPQAGLLVGDSSIIKQLKINPLARALRLDKLILGSLEATLRKYLNPARAVREIPTLSMLHLTRDDIKKRIEYLFGLIPSESLQKLGLSIDEGYSQLGGGSLPMQEIPTLLVGIHGIDLTPDELAAHFREQDPPIVGRINNDTFYLDLRTVVQEDYPLLKNAIEKIMVLRQGP